jgi:hypothetical protein
MSNDTAAVTCILGYQRSPLAPRVTSCLCAVRYRADPVRQSAAVRRAFHAYI